MHGSLSRPQTAITPLAIVGIAVAIALWGEQAADLLRYERGAILNGEWWRVITGHLVHLGWGHLVANAAGVLLVWLVAGGVLNLGGWLVLTLTLSVGTGLALLVLNPGLTWYVGLSGVLHGLLAAVLVERFARGERGETLVLAALVSAKLAWEQTVGPLPGSAEAAGGNVVVDAHLYGAACGVLFGLGRRLRR